MIQDVVSVRTELKAHTLRNFEILPKAEVSVEVIRPAVRIPSNGSEPGWRGVIANIWVYRRIGIARPISIRTGCDRRIRLASEVSQVVALLVWTLARRSNGYDWLSQHHPACAKVASYFVVEVRSIFQAERESGVIVHCSGHYPPANRRIHQTIGAVERRLV